MNTETTHNINWGGKGSRLLMMSQKGFRVPELNAVTPSFHYQWLERLGLHGEYVRYFREDGDADYLREKIAAGTWSPSERKHLADMYNEVSRQGEHPVSVRSSGMMEDMPGFSFAGQYESVLNVCSEEAMLEAVKTCLISPLSPRMKEYVSYHGLRETFQPWMAVVIQKMVFGEVSGVLFTWDLQHQQPGFVISAGYGLGEGVVSGKVETDEWMYKNDGSLNSEQIALKQKQMVAGTGGDVRLMELNGAPGKQPCLTEEQRNLLMKEGKKLESLFDAPQDIEFTFANGDLHLLQSRDITRLGQSGAKTIFDNSNIVESYSGVTTPLTYTFIRPAYDQVYRQFYELMGIKPETIDKDRESYATMVTWIDGRVFYNMNSWFRLLSLLPGYRFNREAMEEMMGVRDRRVFDHIETPESYRGLKKITHGLPQLIRLTYRLIRNLLLTGRMVATFKQQFHSAFEELENRNLEQEDAVDLARAYYDLEENLLKKWKAPILTDFNAMIFHGLLRKLDEKWLPEDKKGLTNDLLVGLGNVESAQPTRLLVRMAEACRVHDTLFEKMNRLSPEEHAQFYAVDPDYEPIREMADTYIRKFGYRCIGELKLEETTVRDNPAYLFRMVTHFLESGTTLGGMEKQEREKREQAEADLKKHIGLMRRPLFRLVLGQARKHIRNREDLRFNRTRIFGKIRELFRGIGREMAANHLIETPRDVFFLTRDELLGYADSTTVTRNFKGLVDLRKAEYDENCAQRVSDRFETYGAVGKNREAWIQAEISDHSGQTLKGTPCSPGKVSGEVVVLRSPADPVDVKGKILVAEQTDPGWVPLFPLVKALLVERGGLLSHSAVVGREMGVPTIVGVRYLTQILENGDNIEMDASTGDIQIKL